MKNKLSLSVASLFPSSLNARQEQKQGIGKQAS